MLRIISGTWRGRALTTPEGSSTRPTSARTREALFQHLATSILPNGFADANVLDLYGGSGALSFEALSRGAHHATIVDRDRSALRCQQRNAETLRCLERVRLLHQHLPGGLQIPRDGAPFTLIFCDPPYADRPLPALARSLGESAWVAEDAVLVYEHDASLDVEAPDPWRQVSRRTWGDTTVTILTRQLDENRTNPGTA